MRLSELSGIGPKRQKLLNEIGVESAGDLLHLFPRRYIDRSRLHSMRSAQPGTEVTILATVVHLKTARRSGGKEMMVVTVESDGMIGEIVFFNAVYMKRAFLFQKDYYFYGKLEKGYGKFKMVHPAFASGESTDFLGIEPVYSLPEGISQRQIRQWIHGILEQDQAENLPMEILEKRQLCSRDHALRNIHFPVDRHTYKEAKFRLVYEEFLLFMLGNQLLRREHADGCGERIVSREKAIRELAANLPYILTADQEGALAEIRCDLHGPHPMARLLQGDVGSGKTVVAALAAYETVLSGAQAAFLAPTEVLAIQHYDSLKGLLPQTVRISLLTGSTQDKEKIRMALKSGEIDLVVGTHALLQPEIEFNRLGLLIADEQHRFGVRQRQTLLRRYPATNFLMMSATPIPRTMAMVLYADVDLSTIKTMPAGRKPVKTAIGADDQLIAQLIAAGQQGYVIYPLIEESDKLSEVESIESGVSAIQNRFPGSRIGIVHGRIRSEARDRTLEAFYRGEIDILIATTVIEVGINIPNASFILIHNAERFGLSQLHQLRGRVGRGTHQAYCFLETQGSREANERLKILVDTQDGFEISRKDLEIRGPGEVLGLRQHGSNQFLIADFFRHNEILALAAQDVTEILESMNRYGQFLDTLRKDLIPS